MIQLSPDMNFFIILMIFYIFLLDNKLREKKEKNNNELTPSLFFVWKTPMNMGTVVYLHASHVAAHRNQ